MTWEADVIQRKINILDLKEMAAYMMNKDEEAELFSSERLALRDLICPNCNGDGEIPSRNYFKSNPNIIDEPMEVCPECRGTGLE